MAKVALNVQIPQKSKDGEKTYWNTVGKLIVTQEIADTLKESGGSMILTRFETPETVAFIYPQRDENDKKPSW